MAEEEQDESVEETGGSKKKLIIMIAVGVAVLAIVIAATLFFAGVFDEKESAKSSSDPTKEETVEKTTEDTGDEDEESEAVSTVSYHPLSPAFLVNFQSGQIKVLKVDMNLMVTDDKVIDALKLHNPVIRNNILMMLSNQNPEALKASKGKLVLQSAVKNEVNKVLADKKITSKVKEVFFTDLVMQ
ncbi:MAG: flagellar basal body-associated FliL family protein [Cycloclasticus sp.]